MTISLATVALVSFVAAIVAMFMPRPPIPVFSFAIMVLICASLAAYSVLPPSIALNWYSFYVAATYLLGGYLLGLLRS